MLHVLPKNYVKNKSMLFMLNDYEKVWNNKSKIFKYVLTKPKELHSRVENELFLNSNNV